MFGFLFNVESKFTGTFSYSLQSSTSSTRRQDNTVDTGEKSWSKLHPLDVSFTMDSRRGMLLLAEGISRIAVGWRVWGMGVLVAIWLFGRSPGQ